MSRMLDDWPARFPGCEPVPHRLRAAFAKRWVRFHALPGSKRYPEGPGVYATMLGRWNLLLDGLVRGGASVILMTTEYSAPAGFADETPAPPAWLAAGRPAEPWRTVAMGEFDGGRDGSSRWHVFAREVGWEPGVLDPVFRLVADDVIRNIMIADPACRWLAHPYDGGIDLILETTADRDRLRSAHRDWASPRPDGM